LSIYKTAFVYLGIAAFCGVFSIVYEANSHGVVSPWMVWLFAWPLLGGACPYAILARFPARSGRFAWARMAHHGAVACATIGSCLTGVMQIYGTSSAWVDGYWVAGILLALVAAVVAVRCTTVTRKWSGRYCWARSGTHHSSGPG